MKMKAETSKIMMSDALRGQIAEDIDDEAITSLAAANVVTLIASLQVGNKQTALVGIAQSVLFENEPEIEFRVQLSEALDVIETSQLQFLGYELHHGERVVSVPGPFIIKGVRIDNVSFADGLCTLSIGLKRSHKA